VANHYQVSNKASGKPIFERPIFHIDVMIPAAVLDVQKAFDVAREARHLSSGIYTAIGIQLLRKPLSTSPYHGSLHMTEEISIAEEDKEKQKAMDIDEESEWLTKVLADMVDRNTNGPRYSSSSGSVRDAPPSYEFDYSQRSSYYQCSYYICFPSCPCPARPQSKSLYRRWI
jgi:hypothetical protein